MGSYWENSKKSKIVLTTMWENLRMATLNFPKIGNIVFVYIFFAKIPSLGSYLENSKKSQIEVENFFPVTFAVHFFSYTLQNFSIPFLGGQVSFSCHFNQETPSQNLVSSLLQI